MDEDDKPRHRGRWLATTTVETHLARAAQRRAERVHAVLDVGDLGQPHRAAARQRAPRRAPARARPPECS
jgi:hypothetical protein